MPLGGYPEMTMMEESYKKNGREEMLEDFIAAYDHLKSKIVMVKWVLWDFVLRLIANDGGESSYSICSSAYMADSPLLKKQNK
jgi:hypothetical protein